MPDPVRHPTDTRIPVTVISGFLGSGKTTLLNHWLKQPALADAAVLINEYGTIGLDHHLVEKVDEQVMVLDSGCICCTVQGSLVSALQGLFLRALRRQIKPFRRLLIETTGLADPSPILFTLRREPFLADRYRYDGLVTVVDAGHILTQCRKQYEAVKQVALADLLVISKTDLATTEQLAQVEQYLARLNPSAPRHVARQGKLDPRVLEQMGPYGGAQERDPKAVLAWLRTAAPALGAASPLRPGSAAATTVGTRASAASAHDQVHSFSLEFDTPLRLGRLLAALQAVQERYGEALLRLKGLLWLEGESQPLVVHGVHGQLYPLQHLPAAPKGLQGSQLVFIVRDVNREAIEGLFLATLQQPEPSLQEHLQALLSQNRPDT